MKKTLILLLLLSVNTFVSAQIVLEWDKIQHWAGNGDKRAAIVVQFNDGEALSAYVWGYRWEDDPGPTSLDIFDALIQAGAGLDYLIQQTDTNGDGKFVLAGIGLSAGNQILNSLYFDFDGALNDSRIQYNYYAKDQQGNLIGPGDSTPELCAQSIYDAASTHRIDHPINAMMFAAPAYDYDYWLTPQIKPWCHWNAGWIFGNWVAWIGSEDFSTMAYAGMCFTVRHIADGEVIVWNFNRHSSYPSQNDNIDGYTGASRPSRPLNYSHDDIAEQTGGTLSPTTTSECIFYNLRGTRATPPLSPGIYIQSRGENNSKILILK